jgi:hypothetical protein
VTPGPVAHWLDPRTRPGPPLARWVGPTATVKRMSPTPIQQYLFELPNAPVPGTLDADRQQLAVTMRAAWASFAANGRPGSTSNVTWPAFNGADRGPVLSLVTPRPSIDRDFASRQDCAFWGAGQ